MNVGAFLKKGMVVASIVMLVACSKHTANTAAGVEDGGLQANGLGQSGGGFAGQEVGESYTTQAPHNQVYLFSYDGSALAPKYLPSVTSSMLPYGDDATCEAASALRRSLLACSIFHPAT